MQSCQSIFQNLRQKLFLFSNFLISKRVQFHKMKINIVNIVVFKCLLALKSDPKFANSYIFPFYIILMLYI